MSWAGPGSPHMCGFIPTGRNTVVRTVRKSRKILQTDITASQTGVTVHITTDGKRESRVHVFPVPAIRERARVSFCWTWRPLVIITADT